MYVSKLDWMHKQFGILPEHNCFECEHLRVGRYHDTILKKCEVYGDTRSEASDWAYKWVACQMLNKPYNGIPQIELAKRQNRDTVSSSEPIDGQIEL